MIGMSHPTWVRGLKHINGIGSVNTEKVAPYVGAWIETFHCLKPEFFDGVAPYVGAWIETLDEDIASAIVKSHPTWVRGLKLLLRCTWHVVVESHPTWVRGLKLRLAA